MRHIDEYERQALAAEMEKGYEAEAAAPSLDDAWSGIETEEW